MQGHLAHSGLLYVSINKSTWGLCTLGIIHNHYGRRGVMCVIRQQHKKNNTTVIIKNVLSTHASTQESPPAN